MEIWDRRNSETRKAYSAFLVYRNLGPMRTIREATPIFYGEKYTPTKESQMSLWSRMNDWVERANSWDHWNLQQRAIAREEAARQMNDRHAAVAEKGMHIASEFLDYFIEEKERIHAMSPRDALAFFEITAKVERIARGEPTESIEFSEGVESVLDRMRSNPKAQELHSELVDTLSKGNKGWTARASKINKTVEENGTSRDGHHPNPELRGRIKKDK